MFICTQASLYVHTNNFVNCLRQCFNTFPSKEFVLQVLIASELYQKSDKLLALLNTRMHKKSEPGRLLQAIKQEALFPRHHMITCGQGKG